MSENETVSVTRVPLMELAPEPLDPKNQLATAHRVWCAAYNSAGYGAVAENMSQAERLEYLARAELTDAIALVCDGSRCGLAELARANLRALDDVAAAQASHDLEAAIALDRQHAFPTSVAARHGHAVRVLSGLEDISKNTYEVVNRLLQGKAQLGDADRLARMLSLEENKPAPIVLAAFEAATQLGG